MTLNADTVADYLATYIDSYRAEYARFTSMMPEGGGYPALKISPYLDAARIVALVANDGVAVVHSGVEPEGARWIAGGPALMADFPETQTPAEVAHLLDREGLTGKPIGIYRLVAQNGLPESVWNGELPRPAQEAVRWAGTTFLEVQRHQLSLVDVVAHLTFGTLGIILDLKMPNAKDSPFWRPSETHGDCAGTAPR